MVSLTQDPGFSYTGAQVFPMAVLNRALPWWSIPVNWIIGLSDSTRSAFPDKHN